MINRYYNKIEYSKEVDKFTAQIKIKDNNIKSIVKSMIFFKKIFQNEVNGFYHYKEAFINDMLHLLYSIELKSRRMYYVSFRSLIENLLRILLELPDNDETGVRNLFCSSTQKFERKFIQYLNGEYGKCCNFIHSNIKSDVKLCQYYDDVTRVMNNKELTSTVLNIVSFYNECKKFFANYKYEDIYNEFFNQNEVLKFLLGEKFYTIYINNIKNKM